MINYSIKGKIGKAQKLLFYDYWFFFLLFHLFFSLPGSSKDVQIIAQFSLGCFSVKIMLRYQSYRAILVYTASLVVLGSHTIYVDVRLCI